MTPPTATVTSAGTQPFRAMGTFSDGSRQDITEQADWTSSDNTVATISNTTGSRGTATGVAGGTSTIRAAFSGQTGSAQLTVTAKTLSTISIVPFNPSLEAGASVQLAASGRFSDNTSSDITTQVTWSSSNPSVASVSNTAGSQGLLTGRGAGTTLIEARLSTSTVVGSVTVTVTAPRLISLSVTPSTPRISAGSTQEFTATGAFSDNSTQDLSDQVTWTSSTTTVATVSNAAGSKGVATGVAAGTSTITATLNAITASTTLTVTATTLTSIAVTPANPRVPDGTDRQFTATGTYSDNSTQDLTTQVTWASATTTVATISNTTGSKGLARAVAAGSTNITATLGSVSGSTTLTVTAATLVGIAVTPPQTTIADGTRTQFSATGTYSDNTSRDLTTLVTWTSSATNVATISDTTGSKGLANGLAPGTATITATFSGKSGTATLTVSAATLSTITVTPARASIARGTTQQFVATGTYTDGSTQNITTQVSWASSNTTLATVSNTTSSKGLANGLAAGTVTISASLAGKTGNATLVVTNATLSSLALSPSSATIVDGFSRQFAATGTFSDGTRQDLTHLTSWASSNTAVAIVSNATGTKGLATGTGAGTATLTGRANIAGTLQSGTATLNVTAAQLVSIEVTPALSTMARATLRRFFATGVYTDNTTQDLTTTVTWISSATNVATISNSAGSQGLVNSLAAGTTTITAAASGKSGSATLTVTNATLSSVAVTPATVTIADATTQQFTATGTFSDGTRQDLTTETSWSSSNTNVATISSSLGFDGLATGVSPGTATFTASVLGKTATASITVTGATLSSIVVTPSNPSIATGTELRFKATGTFSDASQQDITTLVTWGSSNTAVATVSNATGSDGLATGIGAGQATISAARAGRTGSTLLTVSAATLSSIAITPANPSVARGATQQLKATGTYSNGTSQDITKVVLWRTSNASVATVSNAAGFEGAATGISTGSATVTAVLGARTATTTVTVP